MPSRHYSFKKLFTSFSNANANEKPLSQRTCHVAKAKNSSKNRKLCWMLGVWFCGDCGDACGDAGTFTHRNWFVLPRLCQKRNRPSARIRRLPGEEDSCSGGSSYLRVEPAPASVWQGAGIHPHIWKTGFRPRTTRPFCFGKRTQNHFCPVAAPCLRKGKLHWGVPSSQAKVKWRATRLVQTGSPQSWVWPGTLLRPRQGFSPAPSFPTSLIGNPSSLRNG